MLKEGTKHMSGLEEATYKNIDAAKQLSSCVRTSLGPNGMNKMVRAIHHARLSPVRRIAARLCQFSRCLASRAIAVSADQRRTGGATRRGSLRCAPTWGNTTAWTTSAHTYPAACSTHVSPLLLHR